MSNYVQTNFFSPKDALPTGNPNKLIKGAQVDFELSGIATAIATKTDQTGQTTAEASAGVVPVNINFQPGDVRRYGATTGALDNSAAFTTAMSCNFLVYAPAGTWNFTSGIIVPGGVMLVGDGADPGSGSYGTMLSFSNSLATLVTVNNHLTNAFSGIQRLSIVRAGGAPPANSKGLYVSGGFCPILREVYVVNNAINYYFYSQTTLGISAHADMIFSTQASDAHIVFDTWPEFYCTNSRFGDGGPNDYAANTHVRTLGGQTGTAGGPNTIIFSACHFNQGVNFPTHFWEFTGLTNPVPGVAAGEFKILGCHIEGISGAIFYSDSTWNELTGLYFQGSTINCPSIPMFALNTATRPSNWFVVGNELFVSDITLTPTQQMNFVKFIGNLIDGTVHLTGVNSDTVVFLENTHEGTTTINGTFAHLTLSGDGNTALVWNATVPDPDLRGGFGIGTWTPALSFSTSGSVTYTAQTGGYVINGNMITVFFTIIVNTPSSPLGSVKITNLPYKNVTGAAAGSGGAIANVSNLSGVTMTGPLVGIVDVNATTIGLVVFTATGGANLQGTAIQAGTAISGTITYKWQ